MRSNRLLITDLLVLILTTTYFYAGWVKIISNFTIPALLVGALTVSFFLKKVWTGKFYYSPFSYLLVIVGGIFLIQFTLKNGFELRYLIDMFLPFLVFSLFFDYFLSSRLISINRVLNLIILLILFSSFIALLQYLGISTAWEIRQLLPTTDLMIIEQLNRMTTPSGLSYYGVQLSYHLSMCLFIIFLAKIDVNNPKDLNPFVILSSLFLLCVGFLCGNSSFVICFILFTISFYFLRGNRINFPLLIGFLFFVVPLGIYIASQIYVDSSSLTRVTFLILGWDILLSNMSGLSVGAIEQAKIVAISNFYLDNLVYSENILFTSFHNSFLNIGVHLGMFSFIIYILLYLSLIFYYLSLRTKGPRFILYSAVGVSALVGYLAQCLTHNAGPFTSDPYFWMFNGILMGLIKRTELESI